jgi:hypothetical protein
MGTLTRPPEYSSCHFGPANERNGSETLSQAEVMEVPVGSGPCNHGQTTVIWVEVLSDAPTGFCTVSVIV